MYAAVMMPEYMLRHRRRRPLPLDARLSLALPGELERYAFRLECRLARQAARGGVARLTRRVLLSVRREQARRMRRAR